MLICALENGLAVQNISIILITYLISLCETTERYLTLLLKMFHLVPSPSSRQLIFFHDCGYSKKLYIVNRLQMILKVAPE